LLAPVPERDVPLNFAVDIAGLDCPAQGDEVGIASDMDGILGAELDTGVALGAHLCLLVEAFVGARIQDH
jgi:hypothetical protein